MNASKPQDNTGRQFINFIIVGVINTAFGVAVYSLIVLAGMAPQPALAIAFVIGVAWNFMMHGRFVFANKGLGRLPYYILAYCVTYAFNAVALQLMLGAGVGPIWAQILLAPIAAVLSFILIAKALTGQFPKIGR